MAHRRQIFVREKNNEILRLFRVAPMTPVRLRCRVKFAKVFCFFFSKKKSFLSPTQPRFSTRQRRAVSVDGVGRIAESSPG
jgi:hypothetical protein